MKLIQNDEIIKNNKKFINFYRKKVDRPLGPIAIKRQYQEIDAARKRHRASDLYDQTTTESLWCGPGKDPYLFVDVQRKKPGDIIPF